MKLFGLQAFSPPQIAASVESIGVAKARLPLAALFLLGLVAGGFIGLGALYYTLVVSDPALSFALARVLGGVAFSLGLILTIVAGAELFTGNNLLVMAWADRHITTRELLRNWVVVYFANALGAMGLAVIVYWSHHGAMNDGTVALKSMQIAQAKLNLPFAEAFFKGVLCNLLVCLAVWMAQAGRGVADKVLAIVFPISAFVAAGFEHSIANLYFVPLGLFYSHGDANVWWLFIKSLLPVTLGNIVGGSIMVAAVYYLIYIRILRSGRSR